MLVNKSPVLVHTGLLRMSVYMRTQNPITASIITPLNWALFL
jgi:hypothetical protein